MRYLLATAVVVSFTIYELNREPVEAIERIPRSKPTPVEQFMARVARIETPNGNYKAVNQFGMMGKYQFAPSTVKLLGYKGSTQSFLNNPSIQDTIMLRYMRVNYRELKWYIERYHGKTVHGIKISRASILAGAHFAGSENVKRYFHGSDREGTSDANGTTLRYYMSKFSNMHLPEKL
jgi:hypothetical protein